MNKKAIGHQIDWIISTAIFLLYILSIFAFVKPGIKATHQPETLLKIVQDNFDKETKWNVKIVPIFISPLCGAGGGTGIIISFPFISWNKDQILIKDSEGKSSPFTITEDKKLQLLKTTSNYQICYTPGYNADLHTQQSCGLTTGDCGDCINYEKYGVVENLEGISEDNMSKLQTTEYSPTLKDKWGFPEGKEFIIRKGDEIIISPENTKEPPTNLPVYVRQYQAWLLNSDCTREQVTINIQVW